MAKKFLEEADVQTLKVARECLRAAAKGPFFPDWEFQTLFGVDRSVVEEVYEVWPRKTVSSEYFRLSIIGSMNHLLGYPHGEDKIWPNFISVEPAEVGKILRKIRDMEF